MPSQAQFFLDLFCRAVPQIPEFLQRQHADGKRKQPPKSRRKTDFIESDLEAFLGQAAPSGQILVNQRNGNKGCKIDYQRIIKGRVTACCELKGPARPKFLEAAENDWTWRVVSDVAKQYFRSTQSLKDSEQYCAVLLYGANDQTRPRFEKTFMPLIQRLYPAAEFSLLSSETVVNRKPMTVFLIGVSSTVGVRSEHIPPEKSKPPRADWRPSPQGYFDGFMWRLTLYASPGMDNKRVVYEGPALGKMLMELQKAAPGSFYEIHAKNMARPRVGWTGETSGVWRLGPVSAPFGDFPSLTSAVQ